MEIRGKHVLITGGAGGMGKQFALDLKAGGAIPFVIDIATEKLADLKSGEQIEGRRVDITSEDEVKAFFEWYTENRGVPDILVNNAGITADGLLAKKRGDNVAVLRHHLWRKVLDVNLTGAFLCGREAAVQMIRHDIRGVLINISSISRAGGLGQSNYSAAKAGLAALTVTWAKELAPYGIRCVCIAPGFIRTEMAAKIGQRVIDAIVAQTPLGRLGEMSEISLAVRFAIECDFFNGRVLEIDGGLRL